MNSTDDKPHAYSQLFHLAPDLEVKIVSEEVAHVVAPHGKTCVIRQTGAAGRWRVVEGQTEPYWQGWYSPAFGRIQPAPALYYTSAEQRDCTFVTRIQLIHEDRAATQPSLLDSDADPQCLRLDASFKSHQSRASAAFERAATHLPHGTIESADGSAGFHP